MTEKQFTKFRGILQRKIKSDDLSTHECIFLNNMLGEIRRKAIEKLPPSIKQRSIKYEKRTKDCD